MAVLADVSRSQMTANPAFSRCAHPSDGEGCEVAGPGACSHVHQGAGRPGTMVIRAVRKLAVTGGLVLAGAAILLGLTPAAGQAAPKASTAPTTVTIVGKGITGKVTVQAAAQPGIFNQLLSEVNW